MPSAGFRHRHRAAAAVLAAAVALAAHAGTEAQAPVVFAPPVTEAAPPAFDAWLAELRAEAASRGIGQPTIDRLLGSVDRLDVVVERDRAQPEITLTLDQYLKRRLTPTFVNAARRAARDHRQLLARVERRYGVPSSIVVAIWGLESNFGRFTGVRATVPALVTLAYDGRRASLFRQELFAALTIVDRGEVEASRLKGSWAGALGQPQFMPSTFLTDAVDFDGDGRRDIWQSTPDVLASIANYLKSRGWVRGQRWGREVAVPGPASSRIAASIPRRATGACRAVRDLTEPRPLDTWGDLGIRLTGGGRLPSSDMEASLVRLDRHAYLVYRNFEVLLAYNCAHTYALSVVTLAERIG